MNLLFSLSLDEKYNEMLILIKVFPPNLLKDNDDIRNKLDYFKLNAMLNLKKYNQVEEIINKNKELEKSKENEINTEFNCFNTNDYEIEKGMDHKSYLLLAEVFLDCRLKRYDKVEKNLIALINRQKFNNKMDISKYYNQLMLYILSLQNKNNQIVNLIKHKWNELQNKEKNKIIDYKNGNKNG